MRLEDVRHVIKSGDARLTALNQQRRRIDDNGNTFDDRPPFPTELDDEIIGIPSSTVEYHPGRDRAKGGVQGEAKREKQDDRMNDHHPAIDKDHSALVCDATNEPR